MLCLASILLSRPYVVCMYGRIVVAMGLSYVFVVRGVGFIALRICAGLYPFSLKTVVRESSTLVRESWSQGALAVCIRDERTDVLLAGWWCEFWCRY